MKKRSRCLLTILFLSASLAMAGQRAGTLAKSGDKAITKGNYYSAALSFLDALAKKPKSTKTREKLADIALPAYDQKLKLAEQFRSMGNIEGAITEFKELERFVALLRAQNVLDFPTIDFAATLASAGESAAELRYARAEGHFKARSYPGAISEYRAALALKTPYKDSLEKIAECHYLTAGELEANGSHRKAAGCYLEACAATPAYKDSRAKAVAIYYALGSHFLDTGHYRNAYEDFSRALSVDSRYADVGSKVAFAKDLATIRIAFVRFDNATGRNLAGMALGDVIMDGIKSRLQAGGSQFIRTIDRDELQALAREQRITDGQFTDEGSSPLKLEGVDYLVFGKLNQVRDTRSGRTVEHATATYEYSYEVPYTDSKGRKRTRTEWRDAPMSMEIVRDGYSLYLGGSVNVIAVRTGAVVFNEPISEEAGDKVIFGTNVRMRHPINSVVLDKDVGILLEARRDLADIGSVAGKMIDSITGVMSRSILSVLDRAAVVSDPASLKY